MKKLIGAFCFSLLLMASVSAKTPATPTATTTPTTTAKPMVPPVSDVFKGGNGKLLGVPTTLEDYSAIDDFSRIEGGNDDPIYKGAFQIRNILTVLTSFVARMMVPVAILFLLWAAISLLVERGDEARFQQRVRQLIWTGAGFLLFFFSFAIVDYMAFGVQGEIFQSEANMQFFGEMARGEVLGFVLFASSFVVALAVMYLVFGALQMILLGEQEEQQQKIRRQIVFTIIGILVIIFANTLATIFFGGDPGLENSLNVDSGRLIDLLLYWTNLLLGFVGFAAVIAIIWSGVQMVLHFGNEEALGRSKKIIMYAIIGLILAFSAFTIVRFFLTPGSGDLEGNPADRLNPYDQIITP